MLRGCPRCPLTEKHLEYIELAKKEILRKVGKFPDGWTIDGLLRLYADVCALLAGNRNRVSRKWNIRLSELSRIVLGERELQKATEDFELRQKLATAPSGSPNVVKMY